MLGSGTRVGLLSFARRSNGNLEAAIRAMFAAGEQGGWYDPSDLSSMFQDSAGTTPATAPGQGTADCPVGKINDKSGRGNHATQATAASRPVLSGRVNLMVATENPNDAAWIKTNSPTIVTGVTDPNGGTGAFRFTATAANSQIYQATTTSITGNVTYAVYVRRVSGTGAVNLYSADGSTNINIGPSLTSSWQRFTATPTPPNASLAYGNVFVVTSGDSIEIAFPEKEAGSSVGRYQRVVDASTYDTTGFPLYLKFDGVDDSMATAAINFSATDKVTAWFGMNFATTAGTQIPIELSAQYDSNAGSFAHILSAGAKYLSLRGTTATSFNTTAGISKVVDSVAYDIAGAARADEIIIRENGAAAAWTPSDTANAGTGNFGTYPLYIGARAGASLFFNGNVYQLIVRGAASTAAQIASGETFTNTKTGAY